MISHICKNKTRMSTLLTVLKQLRPQVSEEYRWRRAQLVPFTLTLSLRLTHPGPWDVNQVSALFVSESSQTFTFLKMTIFQLEQNLRQVCETDSILTRAKFQGAPDLPRNHQLENSWKISLIKKHISKKTRLFLSMLQRSWPRRVLSERFILLESALVLADTLQERGKARNKK